MALRNSFVQSVLEQVDLVGLITEYCPLERSSNGLWVGWHNIHDSVSKKSMVVYAAHCPQDWICWGCFHGNGAIRGGTAIDFVLSMGLAQNVGEAIGWLCEKYSIQRPSWTDEQRTAWERQRCEQQIIDSILMDATLYYHSRLTLEQRAYYRGRGLTDDTIDKYKLGYADGTLYHALTKGELKTRKHSTTDLLLSGLFVRFDNAPIKDAFKNRYILPYWVRGRVTYLIGRIDSALDVEQLPKWNQAKYKKLATYDERQRPYISQHIQNETFYGEDSIYKASFGIITEGIMDCLLALQAGFACISPGTIGFRKADSPKLAKLTGRWDTTYVINDSEESRRGENGGLGTAQYLFEQGRDARLVELPRPEGECKIDLADFLNVPTDRRQERAAELRDLMEEAPDLIGFKILQATRATRGRIRNDAIREILRLVVRCEPLDQEQYLRAMEQAKLAKITTLREQLKREEKAIRGKESPENSDSAKDGTSLRNAHGVYEADDSYYKLEFSKIYGGYVPKVLSSFRVEPTMRVNMDGYDVFRVDYRTSTHRITNQVLHRKHFNDRKEFKNALRSSALQFLGTDNDLQGVLGIVDRYDIPTKQGTPKLGLCVYPDKSMWMTDTGAFTEVGWVDNPDVVYLPNGGKGILDKKFVYPLLEDEEYRAFFAKVASNFLQLNLLDAVIPITAWFSATPWKPLLVEQFGGFPILNVFGSFGSGKTTLIRTYARLFGLSGGIGADLFDCQQTKFILAKLLSATSTNPIVLDEYKVDIPKPHRDVIHRMVRRVWNGDLEMRGRADQSWSEYSLTAPVCVLGEVALTDGAILERVIAVNLSPNNLDAQMRAAYQQIRNLPLQAFGSRYIPFALRTDFKAEVQKAEAVVEGILQGLRTPDRVEICLKVLAFGFEQFMRFQREILGSDAIDVPDEAFIEAILTTRAAVVGESGKTKTALDYMVETWATMAEKGSLKRGREYDVSEDETEIYIRYKSCADEYREYARRRDLPHDLLNNPAYRQMIRESRYFTDHRRTMRFKHDATKTPKLVCVLNLEAAEQQGLDDLSGFLMQAGGQDEFSDRL